jgi:ubiquinone/menaquinone biosynthesis C-methylase UbiE
MSAYDHSIQRFYDRLGARYDWFTAFESRARAWAQERLALAPGQRLLNVGAGTGKEQARFQAAVAPDGLAVGLDLSAVLVALAQLRGRAPVCRADARRLPFAAGSFDRLYAAYLLDLLPTADLPGALAEFLRLLRPGGRLVLLALTEGLDRPSRALTAAWKAAFRAHPLICGGCRPLQLAPLAEAAGFLQVGRQVVVQLAVPSEIVWGDKP